VSEIEVEVTASALEAALLENETIKTLRPPYNVQLTLTGGDLRVWYSTLDFTTANAAPDAQHSIGPVPSQHSLRPLDALGQLIAGAASTPLLRSQAVGVSDLWTPDEAVFAAGWAVLVARHAELGSQAREPRRIALELAKKLLRSAPSKSEDSGADEKPEGWDAERVARHIERTAAQAYQSYRRARWLQLLHDADIVYREPESARARCWKIRSGALLEASDVALGWVPTERVPTARARAPAHFDRAKYDRLRVLTTELKRVARDGGWVTVHFGPNARIPPRLLAGVLRLV
jgi:hypothetical protein